MHKTSSGCLAAIIPFILFATVAYSEPALNLGNAKALATYAPRPEYPYEARAKGLTGGGTAILDVDPTNGRVTSAHMESSTGFRILDDAALTAFRRWRFKSATITKVRIPIFFVTFRGGFAARVRNFVPLQGPHHPVGVHSISGGPDAIAIYTPGPQYPVEARAIHRTRNGVTIVEVDAKTGTVTNAYMNPSTGNAALDNAALAAFRQWRFKPGRAGKFKIPVTYE